MDHTDILIWIPNPGGSFKKSKPLALRSCMNTVDDAIYFCIQRFACNGIISSVKPGPFEVLIRLDS